jgi:hypothetical protein
MMTKSKTATIGACLALLACFLCAGTSQGSVVYSFSGSVPDGPVSAQATFTPGSGIVTVVLTDFLKNPTSDGQTISGIQFNISGANTVGALTTTNSGLITNVDTSSGGTYTAGVADALIRWTANEAAGSQITLTTLSGGKPNELIIGPDSAGGFDPTKGAYTNANSSVLQHNPVVLGTGTFVITAPGVTAASTLSNVVFEFGTGPVSKPGTPGGVPEPATLMIWSVLGAICGLRVWRRRRLDVVCREPWTDEQRTAVWQTIERCRGQR